MGFANIIGLSALVFVPVIIVLYMLRPKHQQKKIPSLYLWQSVIDEIESASKIHKLRNSILMIIQILAVLLLALILAGLFIKDDHGHSEVILVVDGSMTMQSTDLNPTRHAYAKSLAIDYVKQLKIGTYVTVVGLTDTPNIIVNRTQDTSLAVIGIEGLVAGNGQWDGEVVAETLAALRQGEAAVIYFGDQTIENATTYLTMKDRSNLGIYKVVTSVFPSNNTMAVLTEVFNYGEEAVDLPLSLYTDDLFFGAKMVSVPAGKSSKVFFEGLPTNTSQIKAVLDHEDVLPLDNQAMTIIKAPSLQKILLVSEGNLFLEKVLKLEQNIEFYQVSPEAEIVYEGYDLYIFDGLTPEVIPTDGALLFFDPSEDPLFTSLGHVKNPDIQSSGHPMTYTIEKPEFLAGVTQVFEPIEGGLSIYETSYGSAAYSWQTGHQKGVVFGFDIHQTDLPLNIEFPILMSATFKHLLTASTVEHSSIGSGESVEIYLKPTSNEAYVTTPKGQKVPLDMSRASQLFVATDELGIYSVTQSDTSQETSEYFVVNAKQPIDTTITTNGGDSQDQVYDASRSLKLWIGLLLVIILLLEWVMYGVRRRSKWA